MMNLLPHQQQHAERIAASIQRNGFALDASDPGTGKTYVACAVAARIGCPVVIVTPKATIPSWRRVAQGFGVAPLLVINYEMIRTGNLAQCRRDGKSYTWMLPPGSLVIFDECQKCKARSGLNANLLIAAKRQRMRILLCSATAASDPLEMRAIGFALGLHHLNDWYPWLMNHGVEQGFFGLEYRGGQRHLARLHDDIFPRRGSRMRIVDIPDFPSTVIEPAVLETGRATAIQLEYDRMKRDLCEAEATGDDHALEELAEEMDATRANHMTIILRARQAIELYKVDAMAELARNGLEEGMSVAVFVNFSETIRVLAEKLDCTATIEGGQSEAERQANVEKFQRNEIRVIIANIQAGGVGISLHDPTGRRPRLSIISPTFSATDLRQALGRVHRNGGAASIQKICFAAGTCEEKTAAACAEKIARIDLLNDGDLAPFPITLHKKNKK